MISIIVPLYNEENNVQALHKKLKMELEQLSQPYEILFVDDGSTDQTFEKTKNLRPLKTIRLKKNFGQTSAMDSGFAAATGDIIVTMDGDLQNDPADIQSLIQKLNEGYDVVSGWRVDRHDSWGRRILSRCANWLTWKVTGLYLHDHACAIKAYKRDIFKGVHLYGEMHVFLPAYLYGRGAKIAEIPVKHHERPSGLSKHSFLKAVLDLSDLLTVRFLSRHMNRPLLFFGGGSIAMGGLGILSAIVATLLKVLKVRNYGQTPLPILTVFFLIIGFLLFMMGFLAELILRVYFESQNKTPYLVDQVIENK